jgi:hypothetical protein
MRSILLFLFVVLFSNQSIAQEINPCEDSLYKELYKKAKSGLILTPTQGLYLMLRSSECSLNKPFDYRVTKDIIIEGCDNLEFAKAYAKYKKDLKLNNEEKEVLKKNYKECEPFYYKDYILPKNGKLAYVKIINLDASYVTFFLPENQASLDDTLNSIRRMSVSATDKIGYYSAYSNETTLNDKTIYNTYNNWINKKTNQNISSQSDNGIPIKLNYENPDAPVYKVNTGALISGICFTAIGFTMYYQQSLADDLTNPNINISEQERILNDIDFITKLQRFFYVAGGASLIASAFSK